MGAGRGQGGRDAVRGQIPLLKGTSPRRSPCVFLARSLSLQDLGLLVCKRRTMTLQPPGCWKSDLRTQEAAWPPGGFAIMQAPQAAWEGKALSLAQSTPGGLPFIGGQASVLGLDHSSREEASRAGVQPRMPLAQRPIPGGPDPFPYVGRGPEPPGWQSAVGQGAWEAEIKRGAADQHFYSGSAQSGSEAHMVCTPHMPATDSCARIPPGCH